MSQIQNNTNISVHNEGMQQPQNVQSGQPRAGLPPEMQHARPANRGILARIGAFLFGAGAAGGTAFGLGAGGVVGGFLGVGGTAAAGIATGGAAVVGGLVGLGIQAGIRALVNHFRSAPAPQPRIVNPPQDNLPQARPAVDVFNNAVCDAVTLGRGVLPASLQNAAERAITTVRNVYGEELVPQGATLSSLLSRFSGRLGNEILAMQDYVTPEKMESLVEKYLRKDMAYKAVENAFKPLCEPYGVDNMDMCNNAVNRHPELLENLTNATSQEQAQSILKGYDEEFKAMPQLYQRMTNLYDGTKKQMLSTIAQGLGLDADTVAPFVDTDKCRREMDKLRDNVMRGKIDANAAEQEFAKLTTRLAKPYVDAFAAVDADKTLSEETKKAMKKEILVSDAPDPKLFSKGIAAGKTIDASALKQALDNKMPREGVSALLNELGEKINEALQAQYTPEEWGDLTGDKPAEFRATQGAAFLAMLESVPGLRDALGARPDILEMRHDMDMIMGSENATISQKGAAMAVQKSLVRLQEIPTSNEHFAKMEKQTQSLNAIRNANIPDALKTRWAEMVTSGAIAEPAMAQALIANVPGLSEETRPVMERYILMQSYAPGNAEDSAQKAHHFAQEMAGWRNFDTANDQTMTPVTNWIKGDLSKTLYQGQNYTRSISDQMMLDAPRGVYTLNGAVMNNPDGGEVAQSLRRIMPTEDAAKLVSSIINQRSFAPLNGLSMQMDTATGNLLPPEVLGGLTKMASRNAAQAMENNMPPMLHFDLSSRNQGDIDYKVTVQNGRAHIEMSETVGLDSGLGTDVNGQAKLVGKARYTLRFECDLGTPPSILSVNLKQQILPIE